MDTNSRSAWTDAALEAFLDGALGEELAAVVREMSEREELRPWLRSYGFAAGAAVRGWERRG